VLLLTGNDLAGVARVMRAHRFAFQLPAGVPDNGFDLLRFAPTYWVDVVDRSETSSLAQEKIPLLEP
jgi:hypothetical protein